MFVFLMALGSDYNILVMSRIREESFLRSLHDAIAQALSATGSTVTSAGMILSATFAVVGVTGSSEEVRQLGVGIAAGVLLDTFLVRTLLVPSVVVLLGRWNWWPSSLARRSAPVGAAEIGGGGGTLRSAPPWYGGAPVPARIPVPAPDASARLGGD
jgi:RND superfamily putative drug exporter